MSRSCPISNKLVDSRIVRLVAFQVVVLSIAYVLSGSIFFLLVLLFDFSARALKIKSISPMLCFANLASNAIGLKPKMCDESPKRFAIMMGLSVVGISTILHLLSFTLSAQTLMLAMVLFASLESFFDYCVGCKIYQGLNRFKKS